MKLEDLNHLPLIENGKKGEEKRIPAVEIAEIISNGTAPYLKRVCYVFGRTREEKVLANNSVNPIDDTAIGPYSISIDSITHYRCVIKLQ